MANVKISALPAAVAASGTDVVPVVQGTTTKKLSMSGLLTSPALFAPGMSTFFATPSSANLRGVLTDETGTGSAVFADAPTLTTPTLVTATLSSPTVSTGNLTFSGTAQRILGDFSNATLANRVAFQTSTTNGNTVVHALPNGTSAIASYRAYNAADPTNAAFNSIQATSAEAQIVSGISGTGTYLPMTFYTGGSERVRIDTSGNVGIGTANTISGVRLLVVDGTLKTNPGSPLTLGTATGGANDFQLSVSRSASGSGAYYSIQSVEENIAFRDLVFQANGGNVGIGTTGGAGYRLDVTGTARFTGTTRFDNAIDLKTATLNYVYFDDALAFARNGVGERMRIDSSGNVGIGTVPVHTFDVYRSSTTTSVVAARNDTSTVLLYSTSSISYVGTVTNTPLGFVSNNAERMRIDAAGNINVATAGARITADFTNATVANRVFFQTSTANSTSSVGVIPSGTGTTANFAVANNSDANNASIGLLQTTSTVVSVTSTRTGTGSFLPLTLVTNNVERARVDVSGNVVVNTGSVATNATDGFLYIPSCLGTPTGTPTAYAGRVPLVVDSNSHKLYFYSGGAWRDAGP